MALAAIHAKYLELCQVRSDEMAQYFVCTTEVPSDHDILVIFFLESVLLQLSNPYHEICHPSI